MKFLQGLTVPVLAMLMGLLAYPYRPVMAAEPAATLHREGIEWCDIWIPSANTENKPRVLLIGDSISRGYYTDVEKHLSGVASVARLATSSCAGDPVLMDEIRLLLRHNKFAVIHFNNGLHGAEYSDAQYEAGMQEMIKVLHDEAPDAKLIWASTTLVKSGFPAAAERNAKVLSRNTIGLRLATAAGIPADDLNAVTKNHPEYYAGDNIHYNGNGWSALAAQVTQHIQPLLPPAK
jgi:hypothetical protein